MSTDPPVRRLGAADVQAYRDIRLATLRLDPHSFGSLYAEQCDLPLDFFAAALTRATIFGAPTASGLAGTIRLEPETGAKQRHKATVNGFFVLPEHRGRGLGRALMAHLIATARLSLEHLTLTVVSTNTAAIALYERTGFQRYGLEPRAHKHQGVYADVVLMTLPLA